MKNRLSKLVCLLLALAMVLSVTACNSSKKKKKKHKKVVTTSQTQETGDNTEEYDDNEYEDDYDDSADIDDDYEIPDDVDPGDGMYVPSSYYTTQSVLPETDIDDEDIDDPGDEPESDDDDALLVSEIQAAGEKVSGKSRVFNVETANVINNNFMGIGTCGFPSSGMKAGKEANKNGTNKVVYNDLFRDIQEKRFATSKPHFSRLWFQVDWIVTNEETDENKIKEYDPTNKDYVNYLNGKYDFENENMQEVYKDFRAFSRSSDMHLTVNYGWKQAVRIQKWFSFPGIDDVMASAPYDLDAFADSCAATMKYIRERNGGEFKKLCDMLTFYNEPGQGYDYVCYVDDKAYFCIMLKKVKEQLKAHGITQGIETPGTNEDKVQVWACEENSVWHTHHAFTDYVYANGRQYYDVTACHYYYGTYTHGNNPGNQQPGNHTSDDYTDAYGFFSWMHNTYTDRPLYITEYYTGFYGHDTCRAASNDQGERCLWNDWNDSEASYLTAIANTGLSGFLNWGFTGGCLPDPQKFTPAGGVESSSWCAPMNEIQVKNDTKFGVNLDYYEVALIGNYIPESSKTLYLDWTGDDVRGCAFQTPNGGYSIMIEANGNCFASDSNPYTDEFKVEGTTERDLTINFKGNTKNLTFRRFHYNPDTQVVDGHATVGSNEKFADGSMTKTISSGQALTDTIGKEYGWYIYTTETPVKQVKITTPNDTHKDETGYWFKIENSLNGKNFNGVHYACNPAENDGDGKSYYNGSIWFDLPVSTTEFQLDAEKIDCAAGDEIVWSIGTTIHKDGSSTAIGTEGDPIASVDNTGKVTLNSTKQKYDMFTVKASLKSNPKVFDVIVIDLQK